MAAPGPNTITFVLGGPVGRADLPAACERLRLLLIDSEADVVLCDVGADVQPDAVAVDALARLQLTARRLGCCVHLCRAPKELEGLLAFTGLLDVVSQRELRLEPRGEPEEREHRVRVEEERELDDPAR
jgi:ABC-type transporter Mla MlaB component